MNALSTFYILDEFYITMHYVYNVFEEFLDYMHNASRNTTILFFIVYDVVITNVSLGSRSFAGTLEGGKTIKYCEK